MNIHRSVGEKGPETQPHVQSLINTEVVARPHAKALAESRNRFGWKRTFKTKSNH